jgi:hypothetical protein
LPAGYGGDNTHILSLKIQAQSLYYPWVYAGDSDDSYNVSFGMVLGNIEIHHPDNYIYHNAPVKVLIMKMP